MTERRLIPAAGSVGLRLACGEQLRISHAPSRRLLSIGVGAQDRDDLDRVRSGLARLDIPCTDDGDRVTARDPHSRLEVSVRVAPPVRRPDLRDATGRFTVATVGTVWG